MKFVEFLDWLRNTDQGLFLFLLSFVNAIFLPVGPEVAFIPVLMVNHDRFPAYAAYCVAGSVLGLMVTYFLSFYCGQTLVGRYLSPEKIRTGERVFARYGPWALVIASMFPVFPYRILVIISGCLRQKPVTVFSFLTVGKALRFFGYGFLIAMLGESVIKHLI